MCSVRLPPHHCPALAWPHDMQPWQTASLTRRHATDPAGMLASCCRCARTVKWQINASRGCKARDRAAAAVVAAVVTVRSIEQGAIRDRLAVVGAVAAAAAAEVGAVAVAVAGAVAVAVAVAGAAVVVLGAAVAVAVVVVVCLSGVVVVVVAGAVVAEAVAAEPASKHAAICVSAL